MPAQSWLYTCAVSVSGQCANAHLPSIGGDLVPENTAFVQVQLCGRCDVCRAPVHSDSFAMRSSTYDLAGSGLTFEIMRFGSNTGRDFNYHLREAQSNPQIPSSRWTTHGRGKNLNRPRGPPLKPFIAGMPQVVRLAHGFALASPADRTFKLPTWLLPETHY